MASPRVRVYLLAGLAMLGLYAAFQHRRSRAHRSRIDSVTKSPLKYVLPGLTADQIEELPYGPGEFPGARTVETPYGSCRAYEFGNETGLKVLLIHGISTPCISLRGVAFELQRRGCRVLLYGEDIFTVKFMSAMLMNSCSDLFGRGYSDNPTYHDHSEHLYISQILSVLASSPIAWTGNSSFAVIGYSLGGGIAMSFARYFPTIVSSLVLIAPSGLVREHHIAWQSQVLYHAEGVIPMHLTKYLVRRRLDTSHQKSEEAFEYLGTPKPNATKACELATAWQLKNHAGFIDAFISAIRHAPITQQHEAWKVIGQRLTLQRANPKSVEAARSGLAGAKVVLVLGDFDSIIVREEVEADARAALGSDGVETLALEGGHDLPISRPSATVAAIWASWARAGLVNASILPESSG